MVGHVPSTGKVLGLIPDHKPKPANQPNKNRKRRKQTNQASQHPLNWKLSILTKLTVYGRPSSCSDIWRWKLWKVTRMGHFDGVDTLWEKKQDLSLPHVGTTRRLKVRKWFSDRKSWVPGIHDWEPVSTPVFQCSMMGLRHKRVWPTVELLNMNCRRSWTNHGCSGEPTAPAQDGPDSQLWSWLPLFPDHAYTAWTFPPPDRPWTFLAIR